MKEYMEYVRTELHINGKCTDILSPSDTIPEVGDEFVYNYTQQGVLYTDTVKVDYAHTTSTVSPASKFLPEIRTSVRRLHCVVLKRHYKQRFSSY
jgi:hypothetical protein